MDFRNRAVLLLLLVFTFNRISAMSSSLKKMAGQRVLVTGAGRGIGRAMARLCGAQGAKVALISRTLPELEESASPIDQSLLLVGDVTKEGEVETMVAKIVQEWGGIDVLINNAGGAQSRKGPLHELPASDLSHLLNLNVVSMHIVSAAVLKLAMLPQKSGRILNVSSKAGKIGIPNMSSYVASKFAVEGMTATMAKELADSGIAVNSISPGMVDTKSFPKAPGKPGVRTAESVEDGLWTILESGATGHYLHVDELDMAIAEGLPPSVALKPTNEPSFAQTLDQLRKQQSESTEL